MKVYLECSHEIDDFKGEVDDLMAYCPTCRTERRIVKIGNSDADQATHTRAIYEGPTRWHSNEKKEINELLGKGDKKK